MVDAAIERTLSIRMAISATSTAAKTPCFVPAFSAHNRSVTKDTGLLYSPFYNLNSRDFDIWLQTFSIDWNDRQNIWIAVRVFNISDCEIFKSTRLIFDFSARAATVKNNRGGSYIARKIVPFYCISLCASFFFFFFEYSRLTAKTGVFN